VFIGIGRFELFIPASESLKDKRRVIRSATAVVRAKFNVAIAEVDHQDTWQRSALGVSCVADSISQCRKVLLEVERSITRSVVGHGEVIDRTVEFVSMEDL
jgi:uncharacterized protein YlxP (DUF503 family)